MHTECPEDDKLEWELKCATDDQQRLSSLLKPSMQLLSFLRDARAALVNLERLLVQADERAPEVGACCSPKSLMSVLLTSHLFRIVVRILG